MIRIRCGSKIPFECEISKRNIEIKWWTGGHQHCQSIRSVIVVLIFQFIAPFAAVCRSQIIIIRKAIITDCAIEQVNRRHETTHSCISRDKRKSALNSLTITAHCTLSRVFTFACAEVSWYNKEKRKKTENRTHDCVAIHLAFNCCSNSQWQWRLM